MQHLFIKKKDNVISYCMILNDYPNQSYYAPKKLYESEIDMQYISNKKYIVFYDTVFSPEKDFIKMFFEDELSKIDNLTLNKLRYEIAPRIVDVLKKCKRLYEKEDKKKLVSGRIILVTNDNIYVISSSLLVVEKNKYLEDVYKYLAVDDMLNDKLPHEIMKYFIEKHKNNNEYTGQPIIYGNNKNDIVKIEDKNGVIIEKKLEDFICHW